MSTTTLRLDPQLRARVRRAAQRAHKTPHSFMLEAISEKAEREGRRADFHETADRRLAELRRGGKSIPWPAMKKYLRDRIAGKAVRPPKPRKAPA
jgi:predicted transcriptional regulator